MSPLSSSIVHSGRDILRQFGKTLMAVQPSLLVGAGLIALPAIWITKVHVGWKHNPDSKKRMLISHAVFWPSMVGGFKVLHSALFSLPDRKALLPSGMLKLVKQLGNPETRGVAGATLTVLGAGLGGFAGAMIGGFQGGVALAKALVPKKKWHVPQTVQQPTSLKDWAPNQDVYSSIQKSVPKSALNPMGYYNAFPQAVYPSYTQPAWPYPQTSNAWRYPSIPSTYPLHAPR